MRAWLSLLVLATIVDMGCTSEADDETLDAVDALEQCDIREAHAHFVTAHESDPDHPQAALGFALTDLALLVESVEVNETLADIGFTGPIDVQLLVFGEEGVLARAARGDSCDSIETFAEGLIPYPPLHDDDIDALSLVAPSLTGDVLAARIDLLLPRLKDDAAALRTAAEGMTEPVRIEGGCGVGDIVFQAPELHAGSAFLHAVVAVLELLRAYDTSYSNEDLVRFVRDDEGDLEAIADALNARFFHLENASRALESRAELDLAIGEVVAAAEAAKSLDHSSEDALVDWSTMPDAQLDDVIAFAHAAHDALAGTVAVPLVTPEMEASFESIFTDPIDLSDFEGPLFLVETDEGGFSELTMDLEGLDGRVRMLSTPSILDEDTELTFEGEDRWSDYDPEPFFEPATRYEDTWECAMGSDTTSPEL